MRIEEHRAGRRKLGPHCEFRVNGATSSARGCCAAADQELLAPSGSRLSTTPGSPQLILSPPASLGAFNCDCVYLAATIHCGRGVAVRLVNRVSQTWSALVPFFPFYIPRNSTFSSFSFISLPDASLTINRSPSTPSTSPV